MSNIMHMKGATKHNVKLELSEKLNPLSEVPHLASEDKQAPSFRKNILRSRGVNYNEVSHTFYMKRKKHSQGQSAGEGD